MNRTVVIPLLILLGLIGCVVLMAGTSILTPLVRFVHGETITPLQAGGCLVFSVAGFAACYFLLDLLCSYFVPRLGKNAVGSGVIFQIKANGGDQTNKR